MVRRQVFSLVFPQCIFLLCAKLEHIAIGGEHPECGGVINGNTALNLDDFDVAAPSQASTYKTKLTKKERETTLRQLVKDGWLAETPEMAGHYSIGVSAVHIRM